MSSIGEAKRITDDSPKFRDVLFARGYLFTDAEVNNEAFPFYGGWQTEKVGGYYLLVHPKAKYYMLQNDQSTLLLIGHAYNPFDGLYDENEILRKYADAKDQLDYFNQWTGVFTLIVIKAEGIEVWGDCAGMQCIYYGIFEGHKFVTSHTALLESVCNIRQTDYVKSLVSYRFYPLFGNHLPGDISPYQSFTRLIPNHKALINEKITVSRFFPIAEYREYGSADEIEAAEKQIAVLLQMSLTLITKKWERPAISLTGGCDSKTTLACAKGLYDKFQYFSYDSSDSETVDAKAAAAICDSLKLKHNYYLISRDNNDFADFDIYGKILSLNIGNIGEINPNDIRKRIFFLDQNDFDVEVKSWVSECGRAYYNKRFAKKQFPKIPQPHYLTTLYKVLIGSGNLIRDTDRIFAEYIARYLKDNIHSYPWQEIFFWEFRMGSWNGLVITGEHKFSFDITIPYNNRLIIDLLLRMPMECRMHDTAYCHIRNRMNTEIDSTGIAITNIKHTNCRAKMEQVYLAVMSKIKL